MNLSSYVDMSNHPEEDTLKWHIHQACPTHNSSTVLVYYVAKCEW